MGGCRGGRETLPYINVAIGYSTVLERVHMHWMFLIKANLDLILNEQSQVY